MAKRMKLKSEERKKNKDTRPTAHARYIRISPTKVRAVIDTVRGKSVNEALAMLKFTPKSAAEAVYKVIASAAANAEHNNNLSKDQLYVAEIFADCGPILKRMQPVSKGRGHRINKRTSHITAILDTMDAKEVK